MLRLFACLGLFLGIAAASGPLEQRVAAELRQSSLLPAAAQIRIVAMTPVRGRVETVTLSRFDPRTGYFDARIAAGANEAMISGRAEVTVPVVVASATMRRDHEITASDVELRHVPLKQVPATAYSLPEDVVGKAVRRSLPAGRPIREDDVGAPIVMRKNAAIEVVYDVPGMVLSMRGRALEEGAIGDSIRVVSDGQGSVVIGEITAPGRVVVQ